MILFAVLQDIFLNFPWRDPRQLGRPHHVSIDSNALLDYTFVLYPYTFILVSITAPFCFLIFSQNIKKLLRSFF